MKILAIETSTDGCSVALWRSDAPLAELFELAPRRQTERILPMVEQLLTEQRIAPSEITGIAVGQGPGAFTGVRIAISVAQGLAYGLAVPVVPVSSLAASALGAVNEGAQGKVLVAQDARMQEVYWGLYAAEEGLVHPLQPDQLVPVAALPQLPQAVTCAVGSAQLEYPEAVAALQIERWFAPSYPKASAVARLAVPVFAAGQAIPAEQLEPVYLRQNIATPSTKKP